MSKSLGNYRTIQGMLDEHPDNARAFRLLMLQTHYRKTMEVSPAAMEQARQGIERIDAMARKAAAAGIETGDRRDQAAVDDFTAAMDDDLGTPEAVAVIYQTLRRANTAIDGGSPEAATLVSTVHDLADAVGVRVEAGGQSGGDDEIDALVAARQHARADKDFAEADRIRDKMTAQGIVLEDTPSGPVWRRFLTRPFQGRP